MRNSGLDSGFSLERRLRVVLLLMIAWEILALASEISFGGPLYDVSGDKIGGALGARGSFGGLAAVPLAIYGYAFLRGPVRYRNLLWIGVLEYGLTALMTIFHLAVDDLKIEAAILPLAISTALLVLLLLSMPRGSMES